MKIAVTSTGGNLSDMMDPRFGRAKYFVVIDTDTGQTEVCNNEQNLNAAQGAGIQAAESVVRFGSKAVITGNVGPKAFRVLVMAGIAVHLCEVCSIAEALRKFKTGELKAIDIANVEGHWA